MPNLHFGHHVGTGEAVDIPLHHAVFTGQTQLAGKTTAVEGLLGRLPDGWSALVFRTKRGELGFDAAQRHAPFYTEHAVDWEWVKSVLQAAMKRKLDFQEPWIIKATDGAKTLRDVYRYIDRQLTSDKKLRGIDEGVWTSLRAYFDKVLPQLEAQRWATRLALQPGLNAMDLGALSEEVQALIISSSLEELHRHGSKTVVVIPESWKFIPQARGNPVKWAVEHVIREGGVNNLWMWFDSQDLAGMDKLPLKSVGVWCLGRQMERNEVQHVLDQIPLPAVAKPKAEAVATLHLGHFYVVSDRRVTLAYAEPAWLSCEDAQKVAMGRLSVEQARAKMPEAREGGVMTELPVGRTEPPRNNPVESDANVAALREELVKETARANKAQLGLRRSDEALKSLEKERDDLKTELRKSDEALLATEREREHTHQFRGELLRFLGIPQELEKLATHELKVKFLQGDPTQVTDLVDLVRQQLVKEGFGQQGGPTVVEVRQAVLLDFQRDAAERILAKARAATPQARKALLWLEATGKPTSVMEIAKAFGIAQEMGDPFVKFSRDLRLLGDNLTRRENKWISSNIRTLVKEELQRHGATEEQVEAVVQRVMAELRKPD